MNPNFQNSINKIQDWTRAKETVQNWQNQGLEVVFTNGCFDLIHYGHLYYLAEAASLGQKLVVALNSDASISRLKGAHRPIKDSKNRLSLIACLEFVDLVIEFEEDTPFELINILKPSTLVKGGDWEVEQIIGSGVVLATGGKVLSLNFLEGYSTTNLEAKIIEEYLKKGNSKLT